MSIVSKLAINTINPVILANVIRHPWFGQFNLHVVPQLKAARAQANMVTFLAVGTRS